VRSQPTPWRCDAPEKRRRVASRGNIARITAEATTPSKRWFVARDRRLKLQRGCVIVLGLARVCPAAAPAQPTIRSNGLSKVDT